MALKTYMIGNFNAIQQQLIQTFQLNSKNFMCLKTLSVMIKLLGLQSPQMQQELAGSVDQLCGMILGKTMKSSVKAGEEDNFANRVDVDIVTQFADLLY